MLCNGRNAHYSGQLLLSEVPLQKKKKESIFPGSVPPTFAADTATDSTVLVAYWLQYLPHIKKKPHRNCPPQLFFFFH